MLISPAYAQTGAGGGGDILVSLLPLVAIFAVFYFFLIRPQQKRVKEHRNMVAALRRGDKVVTAGGIVGRVVRANDDTYITVEIAEGVRCEVVRGTVSEVLNKTDPAPPAPKSKGRAKDEPKDEDDENEDEGQRSTNS